MTVSTNVHGVKPENSVQRWDKKQKKKIDVKRPALIGEYNANMGGVDKCDMLMSLYRNSMKSRKWYKRVMFNFLDLCNVNAWLLYRETTASDI